MAHEQLSETGAPQSFLFRVELLTRFLNRGSCLRAALKPVFGLLKLRKFVAIDLLELSLSLHMGLELAYQRPRVFEVRRAQCENMPRFSGWTLVRQ